MGPGMGINNPVPNSMPGPTDPNGYPIPNQVPNQIPNQAPNQIQNPNGGGGLGGMMERLIFNRMYQSNPKFRQFADSMQGKSPEQAFQEQGLDYSQYQNINPAQIKNMLGF